MLKDYREQWASLQPIRRRGGRKGSGGELWRGVGLVDRKLHVVLGR